MIKFYNYFLAMNSIPMADLESIIVFRFHYSHSTNINEQMYCVDIDSKRCKIDIMVG